ncbi:MAG TPA: hypothetical protein PKX89_02170 [Chitinophagales bacterium]|nr:hypothetical protein [Chitinophagales bacterium]HNJ00293.1 hypothetical protein [Chitinophagales bacterium]HNO01807.1 hypothetical protein [Chitinophagales bacterium]
MKYLKIARFIGVAIIITGVVLLFTNPKAENNLMPGFKTPIIAFEFINSKEAVQQYFTVQNPEQYEQQMLLGNKIDYLFMCLYSSFIFCIAMFIKKSTSSKLMNIAILMSVLMLLGDALENSQIHQLIIKRNIDLNAINPIDNYALYGVHLSLLHIFTWIKWSAIACSFVVFATYFIKGNLFYKTIAMAAVSSFIIGIATFVNPGFSSELFSTNVLLVFVMLIVFTFTNNLKPEIA